MDLYLGIIAVIVIVIVALISYYLTKGKKEEKPGEAADFAEKKEETPMPSQPEQTPTEVGSEEDEDRKI